MEKPNNKISKIRKKQSKSVNTPSSITESNQLDKYYLRIFDNKSKISKEIILTDTEFKVLNIAVRHNRGLINLLSEKEAILSLINKGLITITDDKLRLLTVTEEMKSIFTSIMNLTSFEDIMLRENRPSSFFQTYKGKDVYLCVLA